MQLKEISEQDIKIGTDQLILTKLYNSTDGEIQESLKKLKQNSKDYIVVPYGQGTYNFKPKFRGIDPLVKVNNKLEKLTVIDLEYKRAYDEAKNWCKKGYGLKLP